MSGLGEGWGKPVGLGVADLLWGYDFELPLRDALNDPGLDPARRALAALAIGTSLDDGHLAALELAQAAEQFAADRQAGVSDEAGRGGGPPGSAPSWARRATTISARSGSRCRGTRPRWRQGISVGWPNLCTAEPPCSVSSGTAALACRCCPGSVMTGTPPSSGSTNGRWKQGRLPGDECPTSASRLERGHGRPTLQT